MSFGADLAMEATFGDVRTMHTRDALRDLATIEPDPAWLTVLPPPWGNESLRRFRDACAAAYQIHAEIRAMCADAGILTSGIAIGGSPSLAWHAAIEGAAKQGKLGALFDRVRKDAARLAEGK